MRCPAITEAPTRTAGASGSYSVTRPPGWTITTTPRSATCPANTTVPAAAASTSPAGPAPRSTPRWPGAYGSAGAENGRSTTSLRTGGRNVAMPAVPAAMAGAPAPGAGAGRAALRTSREAHKPSTVQIAMARMGTRMRCDRAWWPGGGGSVDSGRGCPQIPAKGGRARIREIS